MIGAVILAAGESRRMGSPKLLLKIGEKSLLELTVNSLGDIVDEIVVVLGHEPQRLKPLVEKLGLKWAVNEDYVQGMVSSFKKGLAEVGGCDVVFLVLGDQPFIDSEFLKKAIDAWREGAKIVSPVHKGKKGHPVLFDRSLFAEILALGKNQFIRDVIHAHGKDLRLVEAGDWAVTDIDTPEDFQAIEKRARRK